jgi:hypothetical protein
MSNFPQALDNLPITHQDGTNEVIHAATINDIADAVNKVETEVRNGPVFNVKHYGAKGDGTTNDVASIQAAIDAAAVNGGTVYLPPGTYQLASSFTLNPPGDGVALLLKSRVHLRGAGRDATILRLTPNDTSAIHMEYGGSDITVSDLTCDLSQVANRETDGIKTVNCKRVHVQNVSVRYGRMGFQCIQSQDVQYVNCIARDQMRNTSGGASAGFSAADNVTYFGNTRIQYVNCISLNSEDFGFTVVGASSSLIATDISLTNCIAYRTGFDSAGSHTAGVSGYAFQFSNAQVNVVNGTAEGAYQYGFLLQAGSHQSQLTNCRALNTGVGGAAGAGFYLQTPNDVTLVNCRSDATNGRGFFVQSSARTILVGCRATGSTGGTGYGVTYDGCTNTLVVAMTLQGNISPLIKQNGATFVDGFFGSDLVAQPTLPVAATDLASVITLANGLRSALISLGLAQ